MNIISPNTINNNSSKTFHSNFISNPINLSQVAFKGNFSPENWCKEIEEILDTGNLSDKAKLKKIDRHLNELKDQKPTIISKTLLDANFNLGAIFDVALNSKPFFADKIWDFIKECPYKDIQGSFILGEFDWPEDTAYYRAISSHSSIAEDILNYTLNQADVRITQKFFTMSNTEFETISDVIANLGLTDLSKELKEYENKYKKTNTTSLQANGKANNGNFRVLNDVKTRLSDVGGMKIVKEQIQNELLSILKNPKVKNSDKPGGIILFGPPGTGKTLLATAIAGEANVPFISTEGSSFAEIYVGSGPKKVRELYDTARKLAQKHPSKSAIVFIDEIDAVGGKRGKENDSERQNTLNALLTEMDGIKDKENDEIKIITIVATNRKDILDSAFRKGRIDLEFKIDNPSYNEESRYEILKIHAKDKPFRNQKEKEKLLRNLANITVGCSGAELADIMKRAYRKLLYVERKTPYITNDDLYRAKIESKHGIENDIENTEQETKSTITHEAGHAINLLVLNKAFETEKIKYKKPFVELDLILNEPHGNAAAITIGKYSDENNGNWTIESVLCNLAYAYGGYSAEENVYNYHSDGVSGDLEMVTNTIITAVTRFGLGSKTKFLGIAENGALFELYKQDIKNDIERYSATGMSIANKICNFTASFLEEYTQNTYNSNSKITYNNDFAKMFNKWIKKNHKEQALQELIDEIREEIANFREEITTR